MLLKNLASRTLLPNFTLANSDASEKPGQQNMYTD
jgi:hypothetical protein